MAEPEAYKRQQQQMAADEQATDERTFEDLLLHLKKVDETLNMLIQHLERDHQWTITSEPCLGGFFLVHDRVVKAYNTAAFIREQLGRGVPSTLMMFRLRWQDGYDTAPEELD